VGKWEVWSVDVEKDRGLVVDEGPRAVAEKSAERKNRAAARQGMHGLVFMALQFGEVPDGEEAKRLLAKRTDEGYWPVWRVLPAVGQAVQEGGGRKQWALDHAAQMNMLAVTKAWHGVIYMALPEGAEPDMEQARGLLVKRDGADAADATPDQPPKVRVIGVEAAPDDPHWPAEVLIVKALSDLRGDVDPIPLLEAAAAWLRGLEGSLAADDMADLRELAEDAAEDLS
jgi:hypothetical protein